jgi:Uma2 family endonuclease
LYEEAGVKEYWIINPVEENVAVFTINNNGIFDGAKLYAADDIINSKAIEGFQINVTGIFKTN